MQTRDEVEGLDNSLEFSQPLSCLYQDYANTENLFYCLNKRNTKGVLFLLEGKGLYLWAEPSRIKLFSLPPRVSNKETLLRAKVLELLVKWVTNNFAQKELYF